MLTWKWTIGSDSELPEVLLSQNIQVTHHLILDIWVGGLGYRKAMRAF
jgi:hypothetical protein